MDRRLRRLATILPPSPDDPFRWVRQRASAGASDLALPSSPGPFLGTVDPGRRTVVCQSRGVLPGCRPAARASRTRRSRSQIDQLTKLLDSRRQAARTGWVVTSTDLLLLDDDSDVTAQVGVQSTPSGRDLPAGLPAVFLGDGEGPAVGDDLARWTSTPRELVIVKPWANSTCPLVPAISEARGALRSKPWPRFADTSFATRLVLRRLRQRVEVTRHRYGPRRITLTGPGRKRASIVFVLDCSQSMKDPVAVEAPSVSGQEASPASSRWRRMPCGPCLEQIGERGSVRVGVPDFRASGRLAHGSNRLVSPAGCLPGAHLAHLAAVRRRRVVSTAGRFDSVIAGNVSRRLRELRPWARVRFFLPCGRLCWTSAPRTSPVRNTSS